MDSRSGRNNPCENDENDQHVSFGENESYYYSYSSKYHVVESLNHNEVLSLVFFSNKTFACMISGRKKYVEIKYVKWIRKHYNLAYFEWKICKVEDKIILNYRGNLKIDK